LENEKKNTLQYYKIILASIILAKINKIEYMKNIIKITFLALIAITLIATGCSSSKKSTCGCTGMVGYK
jgi:hypothetical protein